jgi:hypothetical protein
MIDFGKKIAYSISMFSKTWCKKTTYYLACRFFNKTWAIFKPSD